ncbi:uncharacterized protein C12orf45 homolog [Mizuhopecten yessoensis]|uniref:Uncharacterized protein n=1 Tax=Mizuhopecten yessoensis TaxID=6573 RepID=A0A210PFN4_MIZYE|nr:uncharacterized protein C12orf45 homolog [Mizuhopecten yessoensis]OWF35300.1 hypothetical protein KP79_PYT12067 [Mizuhopecten yessoensis]
MAAPMEEVVNESMQEVTGDCVSLDTTKQHLTKSKDLLNINGGNGITDQLLVNKKCKAAKLAGPRKTFRPPPSSVLSDVKSFLPKIAKANEDLTSLLTRVPASMVDIESVSEDTEKVIEMNISLVPDMGSESDSECDLNSSDIEIGEVTEENFKTARTNRQVQNGIVELEPSSGNEDEKT